MKREVMQNERTAAAAPVRQEYCDVDSDGDVFGAVPDWHHQRRTICGSRKEAEEVVATWNECFKENGSYMFGEVFY